MNAGYKNEKISWDSSIREFLGQTGAGQPTPGGGSAAAVAAGLGAAITAMAANYSQGEKYAEVRDDMAAAAEEMKRLSMRSEELMEDDMNAFQYYVDALKLPGGSEEERVIRQRAAAEAAELAVETPLRLLRVCRDGLRCAFRIAESINSSVGSDLGIGALMFEAAAQSACLTVRINLSGMDEAEDAQHCRGKMSELMEEIRTYKEHILTAVEERICG